MPEQNYFLVGGESPPPPLLRDMSPSLRFLYVLPAMQFVPMKSSLMYIIVYYLIMLYLLEHKRLEPNHWFAILSAPEIIKHSMENVLTLLPFLLWGPGKDVK